MLPVVLLLRRAAVPHRQPRRRHRRPQLGPENPQAQQADPCPPPRNRRQRNVAVERLRVAAVGEVQRLRSRPALLRRLLHVAAGAGGGVPGGVRVPGDGGGGGARADERRGPQLRRLRRLQHGGEVPGGGGAGGDRLRWGLLGGE